MKTDFDAIVVGGGPAGLSAGMFLAQSGFEVLICEAKRFPIEKACGEGIMPTGVQILEDLAIHSVLSAENYFAFEGIRYHAQDGVAAVGKFREGKGWGIRRYTLSKSLYSLVKGSERITILDGTRIQTICQQPERILAGSDQLEFSAKLLIGADGLHSTIRKLSGLQIRKKEQSRWGIRKHFSISPWSEYVEIYWADGVEAYVTPVSSTEIGLAFLWDGKRFPTGPGKGDLFNYFLAMFPDLNQKLSGKPETSHTLGAGPFRQDVPKKALGRVFLIGDAAGYLDPITGEGISIALAESRLLGKYARKLSECSEVDSRILRSYQREIQKLMHQSRQMTQWVLLIDRMPFLANGVVHALAKRPELFNHLLSCNMGKASIWPGLRKAIQMIA